MTATKFISRVLLKKKKKSLLAGVAVRYSEAVQINPSQKKKKKFISRGDPKLIYIYIYRIFLKKIILNPLRYKFAPLTINLTRRPLYFLKLNLNSRKEKRSPKENFGI